MARLNGLQAAADLALDPTAAEAEEVTLVVPADEVDPPAPLTVAPPHAAVSSKLASAAAAPRRPDLEVNLDVDLFVNTGL